MSFSQQIASFPTIRLEVWFSAYKAHLIILLSAFEFAMETTIIVPADITVGVLVVFTSASTDLQLLLPKERRNTSKKTSAPQAK